MTFSEFGDAVSRLANSLKQSGVRRGDAVAIISNSRAEWCIADMAIQSLGGITVGIYQSLSAVEIAYVLHHSGSEHVICENEEQIKKIDWIAHNKVEIPEDERGPKQLVELSFRSVYSFELSDSPLPHTFFEELFNVPCEERPADPGTSEGDVASLVYTSGTTGTPKGVVQRHGNHLANIDQLHEIDILPSDIAHPTIFLYLPLAHSFGRTLSYLALLGNCVLHFPSIADQKSSRLDLTLISEDLGNSDANIVPTVPRLLEKARTGIISKSNSTGLLGRLIKATLSASEKIYYPENGCTVRDRLIFALTRPIRKLLTKKLFGKEFRYAIIGGAKLPVHVGAFFNGLQIPSYEGYGLTETCVVTNVNTPSAHRLGSIGKVLPRIEFRIADDGELLYRGPNICDSYWQAPTATAEAWDDSGWFHTGDIGTVDSDGFVYITDRKKELLVTAGGKKIPPQKIEVLLKQLPLISQAVLTGEGRQYCTALITLNPPSISEWAAGRTHSGSLNTWTELRAELQKHINHVNGGLASYETLKNFFILDQDFSIDNGLLTPTLKVKRKLVTTRYKEQIDSMYT